MTLPYFSSISSKTYLDDVRANSGRAKKQEKQRDRYKEEKEKYRNLISDLLISEVVKSNQEK